MPFHIRSSHICTFSRSLHSGGEGACAAEHRGWERRSRLAAWILAYVRVMVVTRNLSLPGPVAGCWAVAVLGTVLVPCEEVVHIPIRVCSQCCVVAVLGTGICLGLVVEVVSSRVSKSGSAAVQWKGL